MSEIEATGAHAPQASAICSIPSTEVGRLELEAVEVRLILAVYEY
jgi:hypothetical protein